MKKVPIFFTLSLIFIFTQFACAGKCPDSLAPELAKIDELLEAMEKTPVHVRGTFAFLQAKDQANVDCNVAMTKHQPNDGCFTENNKKFSHLSLVNKCTTISGIK